MIKHIPGEENDADIFTKNAAAQVFERHVPKFVRNDKYLKAQTQSQGVCQSINISKTLYLKLFADQNNDIDLKYFQLF